MKAFCYIMLCVLLFSACRNTEKSGICGVRSWIGRKIKFPADGLSGKINRLPLGGAIETFLLNANNVVQLVGSPIANPSLEKLYIEELERQKQN